ncbi:HAD hydrolase-like protein [Patescibacteria group bacterium]|nr:HAD hydrolase-like protein [Patescibacteria group bacterium]
MTLNIKDKRIFIFDMDGTVVDTMGGYANLAGRLISERYDLDFVEAQEGYLQTSGVPFYQQLDILFPGNKRNYETSVLFEIDKIKISKRASLFPGLEELLRFIRLKGIIKIISSNNFQKNVDVFIKKYPNLSFDLALGAKKDFKKGEKHLGYISRKFDVNKKSMLFIGDSLKDAENTLAFGVDFIAKTGTFTEERFKQCFPTIRCINNFKELIYE